MKNPKDDIVKSVSKRTGSSEELTNRIITEFGKVIEEASRREKTTVVPDIGYITVVPIKPVKASRKPKRVPNARKWYLVDAKTPHEQVAEEAPIPYNSVYARQHILDELKSNKKSSEILERFIKISDIPNKLLAEKVFEISPKTLFSYRHSNKSLPVRLNEHILKLEDLYKKGIELFESSEQFNKWLKSESYGLGNLKPIDMINSITGIDLIYEELIRIEFGTTA